MAVHVAITRRVKPGCEREFEPRLRAFVQLSLTQAGVLGALLLVPGPGAKSREYGILRSFGTAAERDAFYDSAFFRDWMAASRDLTEDKPAQRDLHGLEAWFRSPGVSGPPRWKMARLTWLAVWPANFLSGSALAAVAPGLPRAARRWLMGGAGPG